MRLYLYLHGGLMSVQDVLLDIQSLDGFCSRTQLTPVQDLVLITPALSWHQSKEERRIRGFVLHTQSIRIGTIRAIRQSRIRVDSPSLCDLISVFESENELRGFFVGVSELSHQSEGVFEDQKEGL